MPELLLDKQRTSDRAGLLMRVVREIGAALLRMRQEHEIHEYVITRVAHTFFLGYGAILLHDGKTLSLTAVSGVEDEPQSPLLPAINLVERLMSEGATDVQVLTDLESPGRAHALGTLRTLVITPLAAHATPLGAIVLASSETHRLRPDELEALRLIGQLLAGRLRELRLQAKLDATARRLATQSERFDPNCTLDPQQGGENRQRFLDKIQQAVIEAIQTGGHLSLVILMVDHLQTLSRGCGHAFVEDVLRDVAHDVQGSIRARDIAARYNGDEFWVLLPSTPGIGAVVVAERLRERVSAMTFITPEGAWHLTASLGVACLSTHVQSSEHLIVKASQCLAQAQRIGGNQIIFDWDEALEIMEDDIV